MTSNQAPKKIGRLERITKSLTVKKIAKGVAIAYGVFTVASVVMGFGYLIEDGIQQHIRTEQNLACQEMSCSAQFNETCHKKYSTKEDADYCVINDQGIEECCACICNCDYMWGD